MRNVLRSAPAIGTRATWARALTAAVATAAFTFFVLAVLYVTRPAEVMPPLVPGLSISPTATHRYRLAVACLVFALLLAYITMLRWRLHRQTPSVSVPAQRPASLRLEPVRELPQEPHDLDRPVEDQISARG